MKKMKKLQTKPTIENKHMSNVPTSNIKSLTSNTAITLIALIITIIVLLILAGITLNMVMGDSGIFNKANTAKEQTQLSTAEETIRLAVLENKAKETSGETALSDAELKAEIAGKLKELGYTVAEDNNVVTYYGEKTIKIEDYFEKTEGEPEVGITAAQVAANPELYYGKTVTNYTSANGQSDWKIFYSDGTHIFLITGDYVENSKIDTTATGMTRYTGATYRTYWASVPTDIQTVSNETKSLFKTTGYELNSSYDNSKCVSTLLNTANWAGFKDTEGKAYSSIGSPTIEMWMESWNDLYKEVDGELFCNNTNSYGYYVGTGSDPTSASIGGSVMSAKEGYGNELYYPHTSGATDGDNTVNGYLLTSPSAGNAGYSGLHVNCNGFVGNGSYNTGEFGVRPVVSLNSGITVQIADSE